MCLFRIPESLGTRLVFMYSNSLVPSWGAGQSMEPGKEDMYMWCTHSDVSLRYNNE